MRRASKKLWRRRRAAQKSRAKPEHVLSGKWQKRDAVAGAAVSRFCRFSAFRKDGSNGVLPLSSASRLAKIDSVVFSKDIRRMRLALPEGRELTPSDQKSESAAEDSGHESPAEGIPQE